jgi:hypothetical protein
MSSRYIQALDGAEQERRIKDPAAAFNNTIRLILYFIYSNLKIFKIKSNLTHILRITYQLPKCKNNYKRKL